MVTNPLQNIPLAHINLICNVLVRARHFDGIGLFSKSTTNSFIVSRIEWLREYHFTICIFWIWTFYISQDWLQPIVSVARGRQNRKGNGDSVDKFLCDLSFCIYVWLFPFCQFLKTFHSNSHVWTINFIKNVSTTV